MPQMLKRTPIRHQRAKPRRGRLIDKAYKAWISTLECVVCDRYLTCQVTPTEVAHVGARGLGQKCSDRDTLPLCAIHHRTGTHAYHVLGKKFWKLHRLDRDQLIAKYREAYAAESRDLVENR